MYFLAVFFPKSKRSTGVALKVWVGYVAFLMEGTPMITAIYIAVSWNMIEKSEHSSWYLLCIGVSIVTVLWVPL